MKNPKTVRLLLTILQIAVIIGINFILPLGDGWLPLLGMIFVIIAYCLKLRYSGWGIMIAYPISYVLGNLLDTPHPFDGRLPNNMYVLWYLIFIGCSIAIMIVEGVRKLKRNKQSAT